MKESDFGRPVSLQEMLYVREIRAERQRALLSDDKTPLICFTLNIPGEYKVFPLSVKCFQEGKKMIERLLMEADIEVTNYVENDSLTGMEAFFRLMEMRTV